MLRGFSLSSGRLGNGDAIRRDARGRGGDLSEVDEMKAMPQSSMPDDEREARAGIAQLSRREGQ